MGFFLLQIGQYNIVLTISCSIHILSLPCIMQWFGTKYTYHSFHIYIYIYIYRQHHHHITRLKAPIQVVSTPGSVLILDLTKFLLSIKPPITKYATIILYLTAVVGLLYNAVNVYWYQWLWWWCYIDCIKTCDVVMMYWNNTGAKLSSPKNYKPNGTMSVNLQYWFYYRFIVCHIFEIIGEWCIKICCPVWLLEEYHQFQVQRHKRISLWFNLWCMPDQNMYIDF